MHADGIVLYGPPASGKSTICDALKNLNPRYQLVKPLKIGAGNADGYRTVSSRAMAERRDVGAILYDWRRYDNTYALDHSSINDLLSHGNLPVLHAGRVAAIQAFRMSSVHWLTVLLWCHRAIAAARLLARPDRNGQERLTAWDDTLSDLISYPTMTFDLTIRTDRFPLGTIVAEIDRQQRGVAAADPAFTTDHRVGDFLR